MPKGPRGEWRPRDDRACSTHVMRVLTGEIEETYEAPPDDRRPDPAAGGRAGGPARAAKMTPEERTASAKAAADRRWKGATA